MVNMSSPAVSHHLKQLKSAGLIVSRRDGKEVYYKAADTEQARNFHHMIEWLVKIACPSQVEKKRNAMKKEESKVIAQKLQKIPNGTLALEALPGWWNGYYTLWRTVSSGYRWKRVYGGI